MSVEPIFSLSGFHVLPLKSIPDVEPSASRVIPELGRNGAGSATGAGAGAAAGAAAAVVPSFERCFKYSSKDGAAEMDLRGSSSSLASGLRVSAIPPAPMCWFNAEEACCLLLFTVKADALEERRSAARATLEESVMVAEMSTSCVLSRRRRRAEVTEIFDVKRKTRT